MPRPSRKELDAFWDFADTNKDGKLSFQEFRAAAENYHKKGGQKNCAPPSDEQIIDMFVGMNDNCDKFLSKAEYLSNLDKQERNKRNLTEAFRQFDKDGDGFISRAELAEIMKGCGYKEQEVDKVMKECDADGDGKINLQEFLDNV